MKLKPAWVTKELAEINPERDLLKMRNSFREGVAVKYGLIDSLRHQHLVAAMRPILGVSESAYAAWRSCPPSARAKTEARLEAEIQAVHQRTRQISGPERLQGDLSDQGG